ncbi:MAG: peptide chain release factor N(5)-glutamine methyltransferase [Bacteroidales bacterium]|jgi:release factor glutamine methyltransferase|nr:peptide chain release factor N(5)-glutamine methyltransferase [Bacteroidales bacterium]
MIAYFCTFNKTVTMNILSNRIKDIINFIKLELQCVYDERESQTLALILLEHFAQIPNAVALAEPNIRINQSDLLKINSAIKQLRNNRPIQYIVGYEMFCGLKISVSEDVLIPRPETEELTRTIIRHIGERTLQIADLGCGSGCISLALAHYLPQCEVLGFDISEKALAIADKNAVSLDNKARFADGDILKGGFANGIFDVVVSNPPYVRNSEKERMRHNVLDYEPSLALFVPDDDALKFYVAIERFCAEHMQCGSIYLEINEGLGQQTLNIFSSEVYNGRIMKDLFDRDRFLYIEKLR